MHLVQKDSWRNEFTSFLILRTYYLDFRGFQINYSAIFDNASFLLIKYFIFQKILLSNRTGNDFLGVC